MLTDTHSHIRKDVMHTRSYPHLIVASACVGLRMIFSPCALVCEATGLELASRGYLLGPFGVSQVKHLF